MSRGGMLVVDYAQIASQMRLNNAGAVFGIPGSGASLSLLDELERCGIPFHLVSFEGSAVIMAATFGRLTGHAGWSISIKGPGLANAVPGLAAAWFESMPVVHLTEAVPPDAPASKAHKRMNHELLTSAVSKLLCGFGSGSFGIAEMADLAEQETPGPVVAEFNEHCAPAAGALEAETISGNRQRIEAMISAAEKPIVLAGSLGIRRKWSSALSELDVPVFTTAAAKGSRINRFTFHDGEIE